jgi:hypothetical protein
MGSVFDNRVLEEITRIRRAVAAENEAGVGETAESACKLRLMASNPNCLRDGFGAACLRSHA